MGDEIPALPDTEADTQQDAIMQNMAFLRSKNIKEYHSILTTSSLRWPNGVEIVSGTNVQFKNKGLFDGKWIVQKLTIHLASGKLLSEIEFRKCLDPMKNTIVSEVTDP